MGNVYTGIDIGTNSIKIVVLEKIKNKFNLLSSVSTPCPYLSNGEITNTKGVSTLIRKSLNEIENMLGLTITKAVCCLNPIHLKMDIVEGSVDTLDSQKITGADITNLLNDAIGKIDFEDQELVTSTPIYFVIDGVKKVKDPKGLSGKVLESKIVISSIDKSSMYRVLETLKLAGVDTIDVCFKSTGDYYTVKNNVYDNSVGAVVNIGETSTNISVFNKGIQIKNSVIGMGSINVDKDVSYIYNCDLKESRKLKEEFAYAVGVDADYNEETTIKDNEGKDKVVKQIGLSKVVEARIREILKLSLEEIKNLTNRKISYIIVTGGLSEINGMDHLVDIYFNGIGKVCKIDIMGIRNNKFSSALGSCIYFDDKLTLRGKSYNMINENEFKNLVSVNEGVSNKGIARKMFGHFFDN
ncbi:MAG: hypothetical protein IKE89_06065 [Bacilli bacterium]|nr:hypothetical protein [Bacilli bacterium]